MRFGAVDGESIDINGEHTYILLAFTSKVYKKHIFNERGLSTEDCLEFLLSLPNCQLMAYGWNYDVNMILGDLDAESLVLLWKTTTCEWNEYVIEWIPSKWLVVKRKNKPKDYVKICDAFGFFQSSFVNALKSWGFSPSEELQEMKQLRSDFTKEIAERIISYCYDECKLLEELMNALHEALESVDLSLRSWVGAGSIASALMKREKVNTYVGPDATYGEDVYDAIRRAYFGGRSELFLQGEFDVLYDYDINSAYPSEAQHLPSLIGGEWIEYNEWKPEYEWSLWLVKWELDPNTLVTPFPLRAHETRRDICYPYAGQGWYHYPEAKEAIERWGDNIQVVKGYVYHPTNGDKPFDFIPDMYAYRQELKARGHAGQKVLKLGLNAIYGKLAQGEGYGGKRPPFQSYYWAGRVTSATRAKLLEIAYQDVENLVMVATDGIFFRNDPELEVKEGLGGLELTVMDDVFVAQPGVYSATVDGVTVGRSRGFFSTEIDFQDLRKGFRERGPYHISKYSSTRFVGFGAALARHSADEWRTWNTSTRKLSLYPSRKFLQSETGNPLRHYAPYSDPSIISYPYRPRIRNVPISDSELAAVVEYLEGTDQP